MKENIEKLNRDFGGKHYYYSDLLDPVFSKQLCINNKKSCFYDPELKEDVKHTLENEINSNNSEFLNTFISDVLNNEK